MALEIRKEIRIKGVSLDEDPILYFDNIGSAPGLAAITIDSLGGGNSGELIFKTTINDVLSQSLRIMQNGELLIGSGAMDTSAVLQIDSVTKGVLLPRNPDPATNILTPAPGLLAYDSADNEMQYYNGTSWVSLGGGGTITGSGTTNTIPIFTGATALGDSEITWDGESFYASLLSGFFRFDDGSKHIQIFPSVATIKTNDRYLILKGSKGVQLTDGNGTATWEAGALSLLESVGGGLLEIRSSNGDIEFTESGGGLQKISFVGGAGAYTYTLPSATGTIALTSDIPPATGDGIYTGNGSLSTDTVVTGGQWELTLANAFVGKTNHKTLIVTTDGGGAQNHGIHSTMGNTGGSGSAFWGQNTDANGYSYWSQSGNIQFRDQNGGTSKPMFSAKWSTGFVGIGKASPIGRLHVSTTEGDGVVIDALNDGGLFNKNKTPRFIKQGEVQTNGTGTATIATIP